MGEWWQSIKLYQPIHFFQEVVERSEILKFCVRLSLKVQDFARKKSSRVITIMAILVFDCEYEGMVIRLQKVTVQEQSQDFITI